MLPSLARLRWEGFEVNVTAVRGVDLDERDDDEDDYEDERPFLGGPAKTALLSCIEGEGEPPLELLLAAVACAGSGEIRGIPVQMMRDDSASKLDLQERDILEEGGMLLAYLVPVMGALTALNLSSNCLNDEGVSAVCEAIQSNKETKLASLNFGDNNISPVGANSVAAMVAVTGGLMALNLSHNYLKDEGVSAVCEAIQSNKETKLASLNFKNNGISPVGANAVAAMVAVTGGLTSINLSGNYLCGIRTDSYGDQHGTYTAEGITAIADALRVNGALTSISLANNMISGIGGQFSDGSGDLRGAFSIEGIAALADALSKSMTLRSVDLSNNSLAGVNRSGHGTFRPEGINLIADAIRVNGALTKLSLAQNKLEVEGTKAICEALEQNKTLKELDISGDKRNSNIGGSAGVKHVAKMLGVSGGLTSINMSGNNLTDSGRDMTGIKELAAALGVNGGLTSLDLSKNALCGLVQSFGGGVSGTYTAEGITAIANALRVNGALTKLSLAQNKLKEAGTKAICEALEQNTTLKELDISGDWQGSNTGGSAGAKHVAKMVRVNGALTSLDLSNNALCGLVQGRVSVTYSAEGITAIAEALRVNGALTELSIYGNHVGDEGVVAICEAIQSNKETKLASLNFGNNGISPVGANAVAAMVALKCMYAPCGFTHHRMEDAT
eukprot:jgi/Chrpa1/20964/Chrysochromulina_OHIO_Genome00026601-RA